MHESFATALHIAASWGNETATSLLVEKGASVDAMDSESWTPLVYTKTRSMATHLLRLGASPTAIYRRGGFTSLISW